MSATGALARGPQPAAAESPALEQRIWRAYQTELQKLGAQVVLRLMLIIVVVGPLAFAGLLRIQSGTPQDAILGIYVHTSGFAISVVVLSFAGTWGFPIIAGLVAGDMFSGEDRHNTWKTILTRSCSLGDLFAAKVLAAATVVVALALVAAAASIVAGLILVGAHGLVNLSGTEVSASHALGITVLAWLLCVLPALSYMSLGVLFSVASRNGIVGVIGPLVAALAAQLLNLIGTGVWVHLLLIGSVFTNVFGLFTDHVFLGPLMIACVVSLVWCAACLSGAWLILRRRDFLAGAAARPAGWRAPARVAIATAVAVAVLAFATNLGPTGITKPRLQNAMAGTFSNLSLLQQRLLGRTPPAGARLDVKPYCTRRGTASRGPGDWLCNVYVYLPQPKSVPFQQTNVDYDVSVASNGCFKAQSPPNFIGGQTMTDSRGHSTTNPLFVVYGCFNTL